jgi:hypothetical protein
MIASVDTVISKETQEEARIEMIVGIGIGIENVIEERLEDSIQVHNKKILMRSKIKIYQLKIR